MSEPVVLYVGSGPGDPEKHTFGRGDYGAWYASDLIELVEETNCSKERCVHAGDDADVAEFGPGGNCHLLAALWAQVPIPEFVRHEDHIECTLHTPVASHE